MPDIRKETEGLGDVEVPTDKLWDAQAQLWLEPTVRRTLEK
jgi:fumarate hydratase class II